MATEKFHLVVDPDEFTIGDLEDFEDAVGVPLGEALKPRPVRDEETGEVVRNPETGRPELEVQVSSKALRHLVWIVKRQTDPDFTAEDARKVKVAALELVSKGDEGGPGNDSESADSASD